MMDALVDMLKANGVKTVATVYVDDLFGLENYAALKVALQGTGISPARGQELPAGREGPGARCCAASRTRTPTPSSA